MTKLNDTMRILLAGAAQRQDSSLLPLPASLQPGTRTTAALAVLAAAEFAAERETSDAEAVHRSDGDLRYGLYATAAGLAAIGIGDEAGGDEGAHPAPVASSALNNDTVPPARVTKKSIVFDLLHRADGATLSELVAATDWLPHTTRAALTGIRKKGHEVTRGKRDGVTCYRIVAAR